MTTAAAAKVSLDHRLRLVDRQCTAAEFFAIECPDRLIGFVFSHHHKTKTLGAARFAVCDKTDRFDGSVLFKGLSDFALRRLKRQISNKYFLRHYFPNSCRELQA